jgi:hypothetical protein
MNGHGWPVRRGRGHVGHVRIGGVRVRRLRWCSTKADASTPSTARPCAGPAASPAGILAPARTSHERRQHQPPPPCAWHVDEDDDAFPARNHKSWNLVGKISRHLATALCSADIYSGAVLDFTTLTDATGKAFAGIDGTGTWLVALIEGGGLAPAPRYMTILVPVAQPCNLKGRVARGTPE